MTTNSESIASYFSLAIKPLINDPLSPFTRPPLSRCPLATVLLSKPTKMKLLGVQPDIIITVEDTPPDVVFQPPPKPKPLEPPIVPSGSSWSHPRLLRTYDDLTPLLPVCSVGAVLIAGGALVVIRFVVRARHSHREFARELDRLEGSCSEGSSRDPARDEATAQGTLYQREQEAKRRVSELKNLVTDVAKANKRCPWEPRGESHKRLIACSNKLSKALARVEHALEELKTMNEIEGVVDDIDSVSGRGNGPNREGLPLDDDTGIGGYETMDNESGPEGGSGEGNSAQRRVCLQKRSSSVRLATRVKALLSTSSEDASGCVFKQELKQWCNTLATREKATKDRLKHALGEWNLAMVDVALEQLWLLGLPELAKEFREKREDIRSKQWLLRMELKVMEEE